MKLAIDAVKLNLRQMHKNSLVQQISRYSIVGVLTAVLYMALSAAFIELLKVGLLLSSMIAHLIVALIAFYANHSWTFMARGKKRKYIFRYLLVSGVAMLVNAMIVMTAQTQFPQYAPIAIFIVLLIIPIVNFIFHKYWTFLDSTYAK